MSRKLEGDEKPFLTQAFQHLCSTLKASLEDNLVSALEEVLASSCDQSSYFLQELTPSRCLILSLIHSLSHREPTLSLMLIEHFHAFIPKQYGHLKIWLQEVLLEKYEVKSALEFAVFLRDAGLTQVPSCILEILESVIYNKRKISSSSSTNSFESVDILEFIGSTKNEFEQCDESSSKNRLEPSKLENINDVFTSHSCKRIDTNNQTQKEGTAASFEKHLMNEGSLTSSSKIDDNRIYYVSNEKSNSITEESTTEHIEENVHSKQDTSIPECSKLMKSSHNSLTTVKKYGTHYGKSKDVEPVLNTKDNKGGLDKPNDEQQVKNEDIKLQKSTGKAEVIVPSEVGALCNEKKYLSNPEHEDIIPAQKIDEQESEARETVPTLLHIAVSNKNLEFAKKLIEEGIDINAKNKNGLTPLNLAASLGCLEILELLLEHGANIDSKSNYGLTPIHTAVFNSNELIFRSLLSQGANVDTQSCDGSTLLHSAIYTENITIITELIGMNIPINSKNSSGSTPLHLAVAKGATNIAKILLENGANANEKNSSGMTPLHLAVTKGNLELVKVLLKKGASINDKNSAGLTPILIAVTSNYTDILHFLIEEGADLEIRNNYGHHSLHIAVERGHVSLAKKLIRAGVNVDIRTKTGRTPLHLAVSKGNLDISRELVELGANIGAVDGDGANPLYLAISNGYEPLIKFLQQNGSLFTKDTSGRTQLHWAAWHGNIKVATFLLKHGLKLSLKSNSGNTPLHFAAHKGHTHIVKLFIELGADINETNERGWTPLFMAISSGNEEVANFLRSKGGVKSISPVGEHLSWRKREASIEYQPGLAGNEDLQSEFSDDFLIEENLERLVKQKSVHKSEYSDKQETIEQNVASRRFNSSPVEVEKSKTMKPDFRPYSYPKSHQIFSDDYSQPKIYSPTYSSSSNKRPFGSNVYQYRHLDREYNRQRSNYGEAQRYSSHTSKSKGLFPIRTKSISSETEWCRSSPPPLKFQKHHPPPPKLLQDEKKYKDGTSYDEPRKLEALLDSFEKIKLNIMEHLSEK